jgi:hypothetical protein
MIGQRSGVKRLAKYSNRNITALPIMAPQRVPLPPMMVMIITEPEPTMPTLSGAISPLK